MNTNKATHPVNQGQKEEPGELRPAQAEQAATIRSLTEKIRGRPGRPKKGGKKAEQSLAQIDHRSRTSASGDGTISRRTIENWETGKVDPTPEKLAAFLLQAGKKGAAAVPDIARLGPTFVARGAECFTDAMRPVLEAQPGESVHFHMETEVRVTADVFSSKTVVTTSSYELRPKERPDFSTIRTARTFRDPHKVEVCFDPRMIEMAADYLDGLANASRRRLILL